jgi:hypothetical protein
MAGFFSHLLPIFCLTLCFYDQAQNYVSVESGLNHAIKISESIYILEGTSGSLKINDVPQKEADSKFVPSRMPVLNFGLSSSFYWIKICIDNQNASDVVITVQD